MSHGLYRCCHHGQLCKGRYREAVGYVDRFKFEYYVVDCELVRLIKPQNMCDDYKVVSCSKYTNWEASGSNAEQALHNAFDVLRSQYKSDYKNGSTIILFQEFSLIHLFFDINLYIVRDEEAITLPHHHCCSPKHQFRRTVLYRRIQLNGHRCNQETR